MAGQTEITNMALFCDFENVALGVRDAKYAQFDIRRVLERLLLKGSIVVKKAYCDWDRYKEFKNTMHEAAFELIEIPHARMSGKNSADIRMVVDALDLCYTKAHVDAFVIISGDSDFSPLVSKLRENNKYVIGIGVKSSTSDLLSANCDEFIFYDDLVREQKPKRRPALKKPAAKQIPGNDASKGTTLNPTSPAAATNAAGTAINAATTALTANAVSGTIAATIPTLAAVCAQKPEDERQEERRQEGFDLIVETIDALIAERGEERMWGSMVKQTMKRRKPGFTESFYGYRSFREMVEDAQKHNMLVIVRDEKPGQYTIRLPLNEE
ncbi:MAG: NYN domain-containing protein [Pseudomonadota bacterium]